MAINSQDEYPQRNTLPPQLQDIEIKDHCPVGASPEMASFLLIGNDGNNAAVSVITRVQRFHSFICLSPCMPRSKRIDVHVVQPIRIIPHIRADKHDFQTYQSGHLKVCLFGNFLRWYSLELMQPIRR